MDTEALLQTYIHAPVERCFDLARSIEFHTHSTARTKEQAIGGITQGLISQSQEVEWKARHFCFWWKMRVQITAFDSPKYFQDTMIAGPFRSFVHDHAFDKQGVGTLMTDTIHFRSPIPLISSIFDRMVLKRHFLEFLRIRNLALKAALESDQWRNYLVDRK